MYNWCLIIRCTCEDTSERERLLQNRTGNAMCNPSVRELYEAVQALEEENVEGVSAIRCRPYDYRLEHPLVLGDESYFIIDIMAGRIDIKVIGELLVNKLIMALSYIYPTIADALVINHIYHPSIFESNGRETIYKEKRVETNGNVLVENKNKKCIFIYN